MNPIPSQCPVCSGALEVTHLYCPSCETTLTGHFDPAGGAFARLSPEQLQFVMTFVRCEGRFNRMAEELDLSYPTLRNRLHEVIRALGYEPGREDAPAGPSREERNQILEGLDQGTITYAQAMELLQGSGAGIPKG